MKINRKAENLIAHKGTRIACVAVLFCLALSPFSGRAQVKDVAETVRSDEMLQLKIQEVSPSVAYPKPNEKISVKIAIQNVGKIAATKVDLVLLDNGKVVDKRTVDIQIGETLAFHVPWTATAGIRTLALKIDPDEHFSQLDRSAFSSSSDVIVAEKLPAGTDVAITGININEAADRPTIATVSIQNKGSTPVAGPLELRSGDRLISVIATKAIPARGMATFEMALPPGTDKDSITAEFSPRDRPKFKHPDTAIFKRDSRKARDLRVEELSLAATPLEKGRSRRATISFRIINRGKEAVTAFQTRISPGQLDVARRTLAPFTLTTKELAPGNTVYVSRTIMLPDDVHEFEVRVEADTAAARDNANAASTATLHFKNPDADVGRWVTIGPAGIVGEGPGANGVLFSIALDPANPGTIYVGSHGSGVWKTADAGSSWFPITDSLPSLKIAALTVDPANSSRIYVATPDVGIFRSDDAGTSWIRLCDSAPLSLTDCCNTLIVDPTLPNSLYLSSFMGVLHSLDGGTTWSPSLTGGFINSLILDQPRGKLYAALQNNSQSGLSNTGVYELNLNQTNWKRISGCPLQGALPEITTPTTITLSLSGSTLYAAFRTPATYQVFRTTGRTCRVAPGDFAAVWEARWNGTNEMVGADPAPKILWNSLYSDPGDPNFVYVTGTYFWRSTDGGASFSIPPGGPHADDHGFAASTGSPNTTYVVCDGGIYSSNDHGAPNSFQYLGHGITNIEFYDMAQATTDPNVAIGGTQDNGTLKYDATSVFWNWIQGGDGGTVAIDPTNGMNMYAMFQYASSITMSTNGGASFTGIGTGLPDGAVCFNIPFQVHPKDPSILLASCTSLWRASPPGSAWSAIFTPPNESVVRSAVDPIIDLYYAGTNAGNIFAGPGGANWQSVFTQPAGINLSDLQVDPTNSSLAYAAFSSSATGRVFFLKRASAAPSSVTGSDITSNLPTNLRVRTLAVDPEFAFTVFAGTNAGVFRGHSWDNGATWYWTPYNNGLPPAVIINRLSFHPTSGVLRAASFGRSAFEANTDSPFGGLVEVQGKVSLVRVNDVGTGYGPPSDYLDSEVEVWLDSQPGRAFGFQLRKDSEEADRAGMLRVLRDAFNDNRTVQLDVIRTGVRNARILRVMNLP